MATVDYFRSRRSTLDAEVEELGFGFRCEVFGVRQVSLPKNLSNMVFDSQCGG